MYDLLFVNRIGKHYLKEKFNIDRISLDIHSKDKNIFKFLGTTLNESFQKEVELAPAKKKEIVLNSSIVILDIDLATKKITTEPSGLPIEDKYNQFLKIFDGKGNAELSFVQLVKNFKRLINYYMKPYLKIVSNDNCSSEIIHALTEVAASTTATYITLKINGKWLYEIDEIMEICYDAALGPIEQKSTCPICGREHEISFTKTKFFKGKQIITDIHAEKGFKRKEDHYLNFCSECYLYLSEGYTRIFAKGKENEIFTLTKQNVYKLMFIPKTMLSDEELEYLIFVIRELYHNDKIQGIHKINELALNFKDLNMTKGQFALFLNKNNTERVVRMLNVPFQTIFYKLEDLVLPGLSKCVQQGIMKSLSNYVLLDFIQEFLDDENKVDKYIFRIIESIAAGNMEKDLLIQRINGSYDEFLKEKNLKKPKAFIKRMMKNEYIKEMMVRMNSYQYDDKQKNLLDKTKTNNQCNDELVQYIVERGIHPNNAYLIFLGVTMKHIESMQYKNNTTPNMLRKIKSISHLEQLMMLYQKIVDKVVEYSMANDNKMLSANITLALADTFYHFEPMETLPEDAIHNLMFGYGQVLIDNLTKNNK